MLLTVILGPIVIGGFVVALAAGLAAFFGVEFSWLNQETPIDFLYNFAGGGTTAAHFVGFMAGGVVGLLALSGIRWGFTGKAIG